MRATTTMIYKHFIGCTSRDDVKKRYRTLAMKYHPDRPTGNHATFVEVSAEYTYIDSLTHPTFPVSNIKSGASSNFRGQGRNGRPEGFNSAFWEFQGDGAPFSGADLYEEFIRQQQRARESQQRAYEKTKQPLNEEQVYKAREAADVLHKVLLDIIEQSVQQNKTANWLLMEIYKIDDLTLEHFKYVRWKFMKVMHGIYDLKESWAKDSYRNYLSVKSLKWE